MDEGKPTGKERLSAFAFALGEWLVAAWERLRDFVWTNLVELIAVLGGWYVARGAEAIYSPAGDLTYGVLLIVGAVCLAKSRGGSR